jgi:hypothetical protein
MMHLPQTGTSALLETFAPYLDDDWINDLFRRTRRQGRHSNFCPAQLFRVSLLHLLTPVHSFNLLVELLPENRTWRDFARLPNKRRLPDAKMLHQFRSRLELPQLRLVNQHLLEPLLNGLASTRKTVAIMDATDLPAAANSFKKKRWQLLRQACRRRRPQRQERAKPVVYWIQEAHTPSLDWSSRGSRVAGAPDELGRPGKPL